MLGGLEPFVVKPQQAINLQGCHGEGCTVVAGKFDFDGAIVVFHDDGSDLAFAEDDRFSGLKVGGGVVFGEGDEVKIVGNLHGE